MASLVQLRRFPPPLLADVRYPSFVSVTDFARIRCALRPPAASITLHNPPINVIDIPMMEELSAAIASVEANPEISILVLRGSEKAFSAGVDVAAHTPDKVAEMLTKFHSIFRSLVTSTKVLVAEVHGHCLGGGAELAMMCDVVTTSDTATWGFPEISLGCFPPVAVTALASIIGQKRAADLILTGRKFTGREASLLGLANAAVSDAEVGGKVTEIVMQLAALSPPALAASKKAMYVWDAMHFDKGLARAEKIYLDELMQTEDAREGIQAFLQKRAPRWKGK
ncbi:MAG TPA: enoyl-CoA hydratase/isomerase family protein [Terriglobales bacterium]|nr:enoyl-CoA hydratase/isomerase family protein [Terriglobales bacterium]